MGPLKQLALLAIFATAVYAEEPSDKAKKAIGIFNIVKFNNDVCNTGNQMNGTCYTAEECTDRNGVASGSCADGYGVCCVITLTCGATTSENCTYMSQEPSGTPATDSDESQSCTYTICPVTESVRRIRLEMATFEIEGPHAVALDGAAGATTAADASDNTADAGNAIGQCRGDQFVAASGLGSSPIICGTNPGQHMVLDTDGSMCVKAMFTFGVGGNQQRSYRIHIVQFGEFNDMGGPAGCLQYYTGEMGTVSSFNWNGIRTSTHLVNQNYDVCIRQRADACQICWAPISPAGAGMSGAFVGAIQGTFGVSNGGTGAAATPMSGADIACVAAAGADSADFVTILGGNANVAAGGANLINAAIAAGEGGVDRFCGRYFNVMPGAATGAAVDGSVCSRVTPFKLGVHFDDHEAVGAAAMVGAVGQANVNEASAGAAVNDSPLGVIGFQLGFAQLGCA